MSYKQSYWRDASLTEQILGIDCRAYFPLLMAIFYPRKWTFIAAFVAIGLFFYLQKKGLSLPVFLRLIRHKLRGAVVHARAWWYQRRYFD